MAKEEIGPLTGLIAMVAVLSIMLILLAPLGLIVVNALRGSPWGVFTIGCTIPDRLPHGLLDEGLAAGPDPRGVRTGRGAADGRADRRPVCVTAPALAMR